MMRACSKFVRPMGARAYAIPVETVTREWRCKVDGEETAEKVESLVADVRSKLPKDASVQRLVCKAEWDYKVQTTVPLAAFGEWKGAAFAPEADFLEQLKATPGVSNVAAQAYVFEAKN
eukprot:TRINITY_DN8049_c1_g1_i1.p1 TRINITY_DN8049_c1_g1~~TRINITY_DN8049_c1_g1_i1.p1  ORF type:complete len:119 (+),score=38.77 TRINITY_DN8049_c1_g1_i1:54-410(+)